MVDNLKNFEKLSSSVLFCTGDPIASDEVFGEIEQFYNVKLPSSYKNFQKRFNGAFLKDVYFKAISPDTNSPDEYSISFLEFSSKSIGIVQTNERIDSFYRPAEILVFGLTGTHFLCFDYSARSKIYTEPMVTLMYTDHLTDGKFSTVNVASSFDEFIGLTYEYVDPEELVYRNKKTS